MIESRVTDHEPAGIRCGVVRGISYGLFGPPDLFVQRTRELGAGLIRAYLYWSQVEPEPDRYVWDAVDTLLDQLDGDQEVWITLCTSSPWATRVRTDFQPPSPADDLGRYEEFVRRTVAHCAGRVHYWQCNNEPSNTELLWAGTAPEYVAHLAVMYRAVKAEDPSAAVVLGGCGFDVFSSEPGSPQRQFFDHLADAGRDHFDLFSVHLYGDPAAIPEYVETGRAFMLAHGYCKPVVAGEHAGPTPLEYPQLQAVFQEVMAAAFADPAGGGSGSQSREELARQLQQGSPERRAMQLLYDRMPELPPQLQMFMADCPADLEAQRHRINARQVVIRTVLALAAGIRRTAYWDLAPEIPNYTDPLQLMHLMFGKLPLLDYRDGALDVRHPAADAFALLADQLAGAEAVTRLDVDGPVSLQAYRVERSDRPPLLVIWDHRDAVTGDDAPAVSAAVPWPAAPEGHRLAAVDALGGTQHVDSTGEPLSLKVGATPLFVAAVRG
jgi:hypothetical protein